MDREWIVVEWPFVAGYSGYPKKIDARERMRDGSSINFISYTMCIGESIEKMFQENESLNKIVFRGVQIPVHSHLLPLIIFHLTYGEWQYNEHPIKKCVYVLYYRKAIRKNCMHTHSDCVFSIGSHKPFHL